MPAAGRPAAVREARGQQPASSAAHADAEAESALQAPTNDAAAAMWLWDDSATVELSESGSDQGLPAGRPEPGSGPKRKRPGVKGQPQPPGDADVVEVSDSEDGAPQLAAPLSPARAAALEQRKALMDALERAQRAAAASLSDDDDEEDPAPPPTKITVVLRTEAGQELRAAIGVREPFGKLAAKVADVAAERGWRPAGGPPPRLVLDGEALADTETPEGMDVDDGTIVDVYM